MFPDGSLESVFLCPVSVDNNSIVERLQRGRRWRKLRYWRMRNSKGNFVDARFVLMHSPTVGRFTGLGSGNRQHAARRCQRSRPWTAASEKLARPGPGDPRRGRYPRAGSSTTRFLCLRLRTISRSGSVLVGCAMPSIAKDERPPSRTMNCVTRIQSYTRATTLIHYSKPIYLIIFAAIFMTSRFVFVASQLISAYAARVKRQIGYVII